MAIDDELNGFVRDALSRGTPRTAVADVLARAGWEGHQVKGALAGFAEVDFPIPVPRPRAYLSPREAFMYLVLFCTLYVSAFNLGSLIFEILPKTMTQGGGKPNPVAYQIAGLLGRHVGEEHLRRRARTIQDLMTTAGPLFGVVGTAAGSIYAGLKGVIGG